MKPLPVGSGGTLLRRYESLFILHPELAQEEVQEAVDKFQQIITRDKGRIIKTDSMGLRRLSFNIGKQSRGFYVLLDYAGETGIIKELERNFRIDERVLNYQTIKLKDTITDEEIETIIAQTTKPPEPEEVEEASSEQEAPQEAISHGEENDREDIDRPDASPSEGQPEEEQAEPTEQEP